MSTANRSKTARYNRFYKSSITQAKPTDVSKCQNSIGNKVLFQVLFKAARKFNNFNSTQIGDFNSKVILPQTAACLCPFFNHIDDGIQIANSGS